MKDEGQVEGGGNKDLPLLEVVDLRVSISLDEGSKALALAGVSLAVGQGEVVCLVGESGCGKTLTALAIMGLLPAPAARVEGGRITFQGTNLLALEEPDMRRIRGKDISMIFQEPMTSLNPVFTIGDQIAEAMEVHDRMDKKEARKRAMDLLRAVGIEAPEVRYRDYPHQLSGGQRQRVMIAMALACEPKLLIADEPTTALDVTVQAQILDLLLGILERRKMGLLYITHDLSVVAQIAQRAAVMYAGLIVEEGPVKEIFRNPAHPYTRGLLQSLPIRAKRGEPLPSIPGGVPDPARRPQGCPFHPRCYLAKRICSESFPQMLEFGQGHVARCPVVHGSW